MDIYSILWRVHAILMGTALASIITGFIIVRTGRKTKWWFKAHRALGFIGGIGALISLTMAVVMISVTHGFHLSNLHTIIEAALISHSTIEPLGIKILFDISSDNSSEYSMQPIHLNILGIW